MDKLQLEVDHCRAVCDELRAKLNTCVADTLDREADLILAAPYEDGQNWTRDQRIVARHIGNMMKARAALARAGGV